MGTATVTGTTSSPTTWGQPRRWARSPVAVRYRVSVLVLLEASVREGLWVRVTTQGDTGSRACRTVERIGSRQV